jgi:hypothetical protein
MRWLPLASARGLIWLLGVPSVRRPAVRAFGLCVIAGLTAVGGTAVAATARHLDRRHPLPRAGDWEATRGQASFEVVAQRSGGKLRLQIRDASFFVRSHCIGQPSGVIALTRPTMVVSSTGTFAYHMLQSEPGVGRVLQTISGRVSSPSTAIVNVRESIDWKLILVSNCDTGTLSFRFHPAARNPVPDGIYNGQTANGEAVQIRVIEGGRMIGGGVLQLKGLIPSVQIGHWTTTCDSRGNCSSSAESGDSCAVQMQDSIWIDPLGQFAFAPPQSENPVTDPQIVGRFTGRNVTGTLTYPSNASSCTTTFTATQ